MFGIFKSKVVIKTKSKRIVASDHNTWTKSSNANTPKVARPLLPELLPVPEMVEGNEDADWALWQSSVTFQDTQTDSYGATVPAQL
jgi:hypothetical protein